MYIKKHILVIMLQNSNSLIVQISAHLQTSFSRFVGFPEVSNLIIPQGMRPSLFNSIQTEPCRYDLTLGIRLKIFVSYKFII